MNEKKQVVIVLGYGTELSPGLQKYLSDIAVYVQQLESPPDAIIVCGGVTTPTSNPGLSEAEVMEEYLAEILPEMRFVREDCSLTTQENLKFAGDIISREFRGCQVTIFCNAAHVLKVILSAKHYLEPVCTIFMIMPQLLSNKALPFLFHLTFGTAADWLCLQHPLFAEIKRMMRAAQFSHR